MNQIVTAGVTAALTGFGWLVARWLNRDAMTQRIDHRIKLILLHERMRRAGLSTNDLDRMEQELGGENESDRA